jgi:hypothetical protein
MKRVYITHITLNYIDLAINLVRSVRNFSDVPFLIYCINPDDIEAMRETYSHIEDLHFRSIEIDLEDEEDRLIPVAIDPMGESRKSNRFFKIISAKTIAIERALEEGFTDVCYLDSDCLATPFVDEIFEWSDKVDGYPIGTEGIHEYMIWMDNGIQRGNPFEFSWPVPDNKLTLEWPIMNFIGASPDSRKRYSTTGIMLANQSCINFIKKWRELCYIMPKVCEVWRVAPFHEETVYNALKSKFGDNMIPLCYINLIEGLKTVEDFYSELVKGGESNCHGDHNITWFYKVPEDKRNIKVFHGEKNVEESNRIIEYISEKFGKKERVEKSAVVIFSHANTEERLECLKQSILSVKKMDIPIIVSSGIPIGKECEDLCDYVSYIEKNVLFKDCELVDAFYKVDESALYCSREKLQNISIENRLPKLTYGAACINHYIAAKNLALEKGIDKLLIWEYDGVLGDQSSVFLSETLDKLNSGGLDYFYFICFILGVPSCHATPAIYGTNILNEALPKNIITEPKDFLNLTDCNLMPESFVLSKIIKDNKNGMVMDFGGYRSVMPDSNKDLFSASSNIITGLLSGLFVGESDDQGILYIFRYSEKAKNPENISISIYIDGEKTISREGDHYPGTWFYIGAGLSYKEVSEGKSLILEERIGSEYFVLELNNRNIDNYRKLRKYSVE